MQAYLKNMGVSGKLNMNDEGKVNMRDVDEGDNIWEQWTFDLNGPGHISNVAINYKVLDSPDTLGATVHASNGQPHNPFQDWQFIEHGTGHLICHMVGNGLLYMTADTAGNVILFPSVGLATQVWQVVPV